MDTAEYGESIGHVRAVEDPDLWSLQLTKFETDYTTYELTAVHEFMEGFGRPWFLAGGTALDLYAGALTRFHKDTDVAIERTHAEEFHEYARATGYTFFDHNSIALDASQQLIDGRENAFLHKVDFTAPGPESFEIIFLQRDAKGNALFHHDHRLSLPWSYYEEAPVRSIPGSLDDIAFRLQPPLVILVHKLIDGRKQDIEDVARTLTFLGEEDRKLLESSVASICHLYVPHLGGMRGLQEVLDVPLKLSAENRRHLAQVAIDSLKNDEPMLRNIYVAGAEARKLGQDILAKMNRVYEAVKGEGMKGGSMRMYEIELGKAAFGLVQGMSYQDYLNYELRRRLMRLAGNSQAVVPSIYRPYF